VLAANGDFARDEHTTWIPSTKDDPSVGGLLLHFPDALLQLVDALMAVTRLAIHILAPK
jgi:hypothetical protein